MEKELDDIVAQQQALEASQLMQKTSDFEMEEDVEVNEAINKLTDLQQAQSITIPKEQLETFTLDDDDDIAQPVIEEPISTVRIEIPGSRPTSRGPLGGTRGHSTPEVAALPQMLKSVDRKALK